MGAMNWVDTIALLKEAGYTQTEIAQECGCAQNTISDLSTGKSQQTSFVIGLGLQRLASKAKRAAARKPKTEQERI
jgi:transcriptional regulator with XRE-family HTH domain